MFDPFERNRIGKIYVEERVLEAKYHRAARRGKKYGPGLVERARDFLNAIGRKLTGRPRGGTISLLGAKKY